MSQAGTLNNGGGGGGGTNIQKVQVDTFVPPGTNPVLADATNKITVTGGQVAASTTANVIQTDSRATNTFTIEIQRSKADAVSTVGDNGVSHFNSAQFTVDSNGFVSLVGSPTEAVLGLIPDAFLTPGTSPVKPDGSGNITVHGQLTSPSGIPIRTFSGSANTITVQVQTSVAAASSVAGNEGLSYYNSAQFTVDGNGFVSIISGGFPWSDKNASFNALAQNGYFIIGNATATLPASPSNGDTIKFFVDGAFTLTIQANTGQKIQFATNVSSSAGTQVNTMSGDSCELVYRSTNTQWESINFVGAWNFT